MRFFATMLPMFLALAACGGSPKLPSSTGTTPSKVPLSCAANLAQGKIPYTVMNDVLRLGTTSMPRVTSGAAGRPVYGTWLAAEQSQGGLSIRATFKVDPSLVSISARCSYSDGRSTTAEVSSPATVTDTDITILQNQSVSKVFAEAPAEDDEDSELLE